MRAAVLEQQKAPLVMRDVDLPALQAGQVHVKVLATGVCGKQLEEVSGRRGHDPYLPHMLGHEGVGDVVDIGPGVTKVKAGDRVVLHWVKGSGLDGRPPNFVSPQGPVNAGQVTTFSEETIVAENRVTRIPTSVPIDVAALLGCAVTTGLGIVDNDIGLRPGQGIAVFGVGGVGLSVVQAARLVSADPIVAVDLHDGKLKRARDLGATHAVNAADAASATKTLRDIAGEAGFDATVDLTGVAAVREQAYELTSNTGTTVFAGVPDRDHRISIDSFPLHFGRRIVGSHGGSTRPDIDIPRAARLYERGLLDLDGIITHRLPLEQVNDALDIVRQGDTGRCVLFPHGLP